MLVVHTRAQHGIARACRPASLRTLPAAAWTDLRRRFNSLAAHLRVPPPPPPGQPQPDEDA
eukprot:1510746-Prorocentrum_lima.AAC.1